MTNDILTELRSTLSHAWPEAKHATITMVSDVGQGRGVFSRVYALDLTWPERDATTEQPSSVVIKLSAIGPNRLAAIASGSYEREALAYQHLLANSPISTPTLFGLHRADDGAFSFVLQDLRRSRSVDQVAGLSASDARSIGEALGRWHHVSRRDHLLQRAKFHRVRTSTPATFNEQGLHAGLGVLRTTWSHVVSEAAIQRFGRLVENRQSLIEAFDDVPPSLCHGDVRADNLVFSANDAGQITLFDWQQVAVQAAEADLAWLAATSLAPDVRADVEPDLVREFAARSGQSLAETAANYRASFVLPGLAVLFLAQRELKDDRTQAFVAVTLQRIAQALADHELA